MLWLNTACIKSDDDGNDDGDLFVLLARTNLSKHILTFFAAMTTMEMKQWQIENATWTKSKPCVKEDCHDPVVFPTFLGDSSNENEEVRGTYQSRDDACI